MKKALIILIISSAVLATALAGGASETIGSGNGTYQNGNGAGSGNGGGANATSFSQDNIANTIGSIEKKPLDDSEKEGILLMREEEKLARDVYSALYAKWNIPVFSNIARAEQTHMDAVGILIDRYGLDDPIKNDVPGTFVNPELQKLYNSLVEEGSESLLAATKVGAEVEDLDIADLLRLMSETDNDDIKVIYQNLEKGSRNHLRSFMFQVDRNGGSYSAKYISSDYFNRIVGSDRETGTVITDPNFKF